MKTGRILLFGLLCILSLNCRAQGFFIGAEAGVAIFPDFTEQVARSAPAGFSSVTVEQDAGGAAFGIYGGAWVTENFGFEAAYTDLGSIEGRVTTVPASNTFYKYSASAFSVAGLAGIRVGRGTLYGKVGLYRASVQFESVSRSVETTSNGVIFGGGYSFPFTRHLVGKAEIAVYNGVDFQTFNAPQGTTTSDDITRISVGVAYMF